MVKLVRRHPSWKLFLSYLVVILVGIVVLASAAEFAVPTAFDRHMSAMADMTLAPALRSGASAGVGGRMMGMGMDLYRNFRSAVTEALAVAGIAAFLAAVSWMAAMTRFELSYAYPFTSLAFVLVLGFSALFFHEAITVPKALGVGLIMAGIIIGSQG